MNTYKKNTQSALDTLNTKLNQTNDLEQNLISVTSFFDEFHSNDYVGEALKDEIYIFIHNIKTRVIPNALLDINKTN